MRTASATITVIVVILVSLGLVMLASTSTIRGASEFNDPHFFLKKQVVWVALAATCGFIAACFDYHEWRRPWVMGVLASITLLGLLLVFVPGIGRRVGGSYRWIRLGFFSIQPSEIAKLLSIVGVSLWMARIGRRAAEFKPGILYPLLGLGLLMGLVIAEPDYGTTVLIGSVGMALMFVGGAHAGWLSLIAGGGVGVLAVAIALNPNRAGRVLAFLFPEKYPEVAYHLTQSKLAFLNGGWKGVGLGNSMQKQHYLPEAHTDFILAIIGEELGIIATLAIVVLFAVLLFCGLYISRKARDPFGRLLAFGLTLMLTLQAAINVAVVTGCVPTKGLPLPFISYGGSSMIASLTAIGMLINVALHGTAEYNDRHDKPIRDRLNRAI